MAGNSVIIINLSTMKFVRYLLIAFLISNTITNAYSQDNSTVGQPIIDFDTELEKLAKSIAKKINSKEKKKVAVWNFMKETGEEESFGNFITEDFSVYITNFGQSYEVIDRAHLQTLLKEHDLNLDGFIDSKTTKSLGKIIAVDVVITGTYSIVGSTMKIRAKALDTETALQFAAAMIRIPINEDVSSFLGISVNGTTNTITNKGFNRPISSNETVNNPKTVDPACEKKDFGDLCLYNVTKDTILSKLTDGKRIDKAIFNKDLILKPKETKCYYKVPSMTTTYYIINKNQLGHQFKTVLDITYINNVKYLRDKGEIHVEKCKSKTFTIR
jgi:TolB-like protein